MESSRTRAQTRVPCIGRRILNHCTTREVPRLLLIKKKQNRYFKLRNLVLFYVWEDARVWAHWNHSFDSLRYLGPVSCFFPILSHLREHHWGWLQWLRAWQWAACVSCRLKKKKCTTWVLQVKFYLGQNQDCSPVDSISDSSEKLLWRGGGKVSIYVILVKGVHAIKHTFLQKVAASHKEQVSPFMILVLF